jgi:acetolactate synthase-1/2/3 large subunit
MLWVTPTLKRLHPNFDLSLASGSMGIALPGAMGCCVAGAFEGATQHVVAIIGDAAFKMGGMELHTALEENLNLITVIWNDHGHGLVDSGSHQIFHSPVGQYRFKHRINCAGIARAMGIQASVSRSPRELRTALAAALGRQGPTLIDVWIDERVPLPLGARGKAFSFHAD